MLERVFLGWDRPFLHAAADWLLACGDDLPHLLVVVPTSQGARRLKEALAERAGAILSPRMMTPGSFLCTEGPDVAPDWMERVAWLEAMEAISDWSPYADLFPEPPEGDDWAVGLVGELAGVRRSLQENGHTLASAARVLANSVEAGRWEALARLEVAVENHLRDWGYKSRSRTLAAGISLPDGCTRIVLVGITEMPPLVVRMLSNSPHTVHSLIGAPRDEEAAFSPIGRPLPVWSERSLPWPDGGWGSVRLVADARQQAIEAYRIVCEAGTQSDQVALGSADTAIGDDLARTFTRGGWTAFHPATVSLRTGLARWFKALSAWIADPRLAHVSVLLALPETEALVGKRRAFIGRELSKLRNQWMSTRPEDLKHRAATSDFRTDQHRELAQDVIRAVEIFESVRSEFISASTADALRRILDLFDQIPDADRNRTMAYHDWLDAATTLIHQVDRKASYSIDLMLSSIPPAPPLPPPGRVIDVHGWLELYLEPGTHLVLCGMNEGAVPARNSADPWLGENAAKLLGLNINSSRAARDAFLYQSMLLARKDIGRVDLICAKSGAGGEALLPSRLLLAAERDQLPERVAFLFRGIEPPEAGLRWHADWKWQPRLIEVTNRLNATALSTYLACPFRFYLKHAVGMQMPEPERVEWNHRDFGNVAHEVLERWGRDEEAREFSKSEAVHAWMSAELDKVVAEWFGKRIPLSIRVQTEALRQRLSWLARIQACSRAEGWQVIDIEHKFELEFNNTIVVAKIDRIDRHRETGQLRVLDYKTGRVETVEKSHRKRITAKTILPPHIPPGGPPVFSGEEKGKPADFLWYNLQLPLYATAVAKRDGVIPIPCYFTLGVTEADVEIRDWQNFSEAELQSAEACTAWIADQVAARVFWPPAEKVTYDDFSLLASGRNFEEVFLPAGLPGMAD